MARMTSEEFAAKEKELLAKMPPELRSTLSMMAYERGHSAGYEEIIGILSGLVSDLQAPLLALEMRLRNQKP